jgi:hypothetical protein
VVGFLRDGGFTVYCGEERLRGLGERLRLE